MSEKTRPYHIVDLTRARRAWLNMLDLPGPEHSMYGLLEVDVTAARQFIAEHKARTGETLSFTGYLTCCLARAVDEDKAVQAYLKGRKQLVLFDDVDVGLMVERTRSARKGALMGHVIRGANRKTYREIHRGDPHGPVRTDAAGRGHARLVPVCHAASLAAGRGCSRRCSAWRCAATRRFSCP